MSNNSRSEDSSILFKLVYELEGRTDGRHVDRYNPYWALATQVAEQIRLIVDQQNVERTKQDSCIQSISFQDKQKVICMYSCKVCSLSRCLL